MDVLELLAYYSADHPKSALFYSSATEQEIDEFEIVVGLFVAM